MTDRDDILLILGRLEGKVDAFTSSQQTQDSRLKELEDKLNALVIRVALIAGLVGGGAGFATGVIH